LVLDRGRLLAGGFGDAALAVARRITVACAPLQRCEAVLMGSPGTRFGLRPPLAVGAAICCADRVSSWPRHDGAKTLDSDPAEPLASAAPERRAS